MEEIIKIPKIKICGITEEREAEFLNEGKADYAGMVFYEKSRRNISFTRAEKLIRRLHTDMVKVAVSVNPDLEFAKEAAQKGFDLLQVHGNLAKEVRENSPLPLWRAVNITDLKTLHAFFEEEEREGTEKITGYVADGSGYGGGRPFDWKGLGGQVRAQIKGKQMILAGGLTEQNVKEGIRCFMPDVVDVSSGVEEEGKKSKSKITMFIRKVREDEQ